MMRTLLIALFTCYTLAAPVTPAQAASNPPLIASAEGISEYRLPNGLRVLLMPDGSKNTVTINMTYLVGSRHENAGQSGYAHLLEHMLYKSSQQFPKIAEEISRRGGRWNGTTNDDRTNFFEIIPASDTELDWMLAMEADRMRNVRFSADELRREVTIVKNELELREGNPYNSLMHQVKSVAFDWHGYGHIAIGERSDLDAAQTAELEQFYRRYYRPDNAVLLVAGQFQPEQVLGSIQKYFGSIPKPSQSLPLIATVEPGSLGERSVIVRKPANFSAAVEAYHVPSALHPDFAAIKFAATVLSSEREQRDADQSVHRLSHSMYSLSPGMRDSGLIYFITRQQSAKQIDDQSKLMQKAIDQFPQRLMSEQDLRFFKAQFAASYTHTLDDPEALAIRLSEYIALGDWRMFFVEKARIAALTAEQVQAAAKKYLKKNNRISGLLYAEPNQPVEIPAAPDVNDILKQFKHVDEYAPVSGFDASYDNLMAQSQRIKIGNIEVVLLPKPSRGQVVTVDLRLHWGNLQSLHEKKWVEYFTDQALLNGAGQYGKESLEAERARLHMKGSVRHFSTTRADLREALSLMMLNLKQPSFGQAMDIVARHRVSLDLERKTPLRKIEDRYAQHFNTYPTSDPRRLETSQQSISEMNAIKSADFFEFHKNFYGASSGHLVIVGDFEPQDVLTSLTPEFSGWDSKSPYAEIHQQAPERPAMSASIDTPGESSAYFYGRRYLPVGKAHPDFPALVVINYLLGQAGLESRLMQRLRQQEGWSYSVQSQFSADQTDPYARWDIVASSAPENLLKLRQAVTEVLQNVQQQGFLEAELKKAKLNIARADAQHRQSNQQLADMWNAALHEGQDLRIFQRLEASIQALTLEQVNQVAKKYVQPESWSVVTTADAAKAGKTASTK
ncbi:MAG: M16 family metallopeptidase [Undibacterium curvum]|uniref:M16 family metallopeptidase n=1 Tax=Undibacterium curvum TaxID=2762294 RepID=UPI003BBA9231